MSDINQVNEIITSTVKRNVENVCPTVEVTKKKEPWEDETMNQLMIKLLSQDISQDRKEVQKTIKNQRKKLKNEYYKELADNNKLAISNDKLKTHFESHFAERKMPTPPELERPQISLSQFMK